MVERSFLYATFVFTTISGVHYVIRTGNRLRRGELRSPAARNAG
jgi:hypothetical protein